MPRIRSVNDYHNLLQFDRRRIVANSVYSLSYNDIASHNRRNSTIWNRLIQNSLTEHCLRQRSTTTSVREDRHIHRYCKATVVYPMTKLDTGATTRNLFRRIQYVSYGRLACLILQVVCHGQQCTYYAVRLLCFVTEDTY
ncbi:hypothetical protein TNCV_2402621 [Trichonephila clavipes]|nr:hypothetical protein TNCV_2402621 [Trichonephila clavipes]